MRIPSPEDVDRQQPDATPSTLPEYPTATDLEAFTGTPASTWRYWAHIGSGPPSFKLGRRRVWKRAVVLAWLADQESASA